MDDRVTLEEERRMGRTLILVGLLVVLVSLLAIVAGGFALWGFARRVLR